MITYNAPRGYLFDWKNLESHQEIDKETNQVIQLHLNACSLSLTDMDSIANYILVENEAELAKMAEEERLAELERLGITEDKEGEKKDVLLQK